MREFLKRRGAPLWLVISLIMMLVSAVGASVVQTAGGSVVVKDMYWETPSGLSQSALLFKPDTATADNPAPAVVVSHGMYNHREMQDVVYTELARRGYVVIAIDMYGHGKSQAVTAEERDGAQATGMYDAVELVAALPYVDADRIGVTGHSYGGRSANWSVEIDNEKDDPLIAAVLLQAADAIYADADTGEFENLYGSRDVGIVQSEYDEFFFRTTAEDGTTTLPRDFLTTANAQSFLNFGIDPSTGGEEREQGVVYTEDIDGTSAIRVIYSHAEIHPWVHFAASTAQDAVEFFEQALGAPNPIPSTNQVWQIKTAFNTLGLVGYFVFLVALTGVLLRTRLFSSQKNQVAAAPAIQGRSAKWWLWGGLVASAIFSGVTYIWLYPIVSSWQPGFRTQYPPLFVGTWSAVNGLFAVLVMWLAYRAQVKAGAVPATGAGLRISWRKLGNTLLLAAVVVFSAVLITFLVDYFFKTDFRIWTLAVKAFAVQNVSMFWLYLPLFAIYFVANAVAFSVFDRFTFFGKEWVNTAMLGLMNALPMIVILIIQYGTFFITGEMNPLIGAMPGIWAFNISVILFVTVVVGRKIYRMTANPYLAGLINAAIITLINVTTTQQLS